MSNIDMLIEDLIGEQVETLIQDDSYYEMFATPLKPASEFKKAHKQQLIDFFKLTELKQELEKAPDLINTLMPKLISAVEAEKIKKELEDSADHFVHFLDSMQNIEASETPVLFQEMFGLSDDTLLHVYDLAVNLVKEAYYEDALTLFVFLTTMAPHVPSYWIAQGACLQALERHEEAIAVFNAAKYLNSNNPAISSYIIESYLLLKDKERAKLELNVLKEIVKRLSGDEKALWEEKIKAITILN